MPDKLEIMRAISTGLNEIDRKTLRPERETKWTCAILSKLCMIGRQQFQYRTRASSDDAHNTEWLYDLVWLRYNDNPDRQLLDVPLAAECEWGAYDSPGGIRDDFQKLLLAQAGVRVMIYSGLRRPPDHPKQHLYSLPTAKRLATHIREFNSRAENAWLLAAWENDADNRKSWFRFFTIENNQVIPFP